MARRWRWGTHGAQQSLRQVGSALLWLFALLGAWLLVLLVLVLLSMWLP